MHLSQKHTYTQNLALTNLLLLLLLLRITYRNDLPCAGWGTDKRSFLKPAAFIIHKL